MAFEKSPLSLIFLYCQKNQNQLQNGAQLFSGVSLFLCHKFCSRETSAGH